MKNDLPIFVYGTLKQGYANHDRYCLSATSCIAAEVVGDLFLHPAGYPLLQIADPRGCPLGSGDHAYDVKGVAEMNQHLSREAEPPSRPAGERWVRGELLELEAGAAALPGLDRLEWFRPEPDRLMTSEYWRVILPVFPLDGGPARYAWTYVLPPDVETSGYTPISSGIWGGDARTASDRS